MIPARSPKKIDELIRTTTRRRKDSAKLLSRHTSLMIMFVSAPEIFISIVVLPHSSKYVRFTHFRKPLTKKNFPSIKAFKIRCVYLVALKL